MYVIGIEYTFIGSKIRLLPTREQEELLWKSAGCSRFIYNWALTKQIENYKNGNKFIKDTELRKEMTLLKKEKDYEFLNEIGSNVLKQSVKDLCLAYKKFFNKKASFPRYKTRKSNISFYVNYESMKKTQNGVQCEKLGNIRTSEQLPKLLKGEKHYLEPHISFDGKYWYIDFTRKIKIHKTKFNDITIGIDLGIKNLATCSNKKVYKNINKTKKVRKLKKKLKRLQRKVSKKYLMNKVGNKYIKTKNIIKLERKIKLVHRTLTNIRINHIHQVTTEIVKTKPSKIVMETLRITNMLKNKHLSKAISEQSFYRFISFIEYKCKLYGIEFAKVPTFYPSSKLCSRCGHKKKDLKLSDRTYRCSHCGLEIDRDYNASINLANYKINS
ncbi:putative transposase [Fusobacterium phage vB_FnuS_FNU3]|uniref:Transposase n=1 Tax=Fusobacterium phage Fnu1 TaxID=2530024 RepID=A0A481W756_9CAUD|nr:transposase [Fusobacterium phage Fnu1]QBJ04072.1 transposase [Fusobacterium phage Fnu1]WGH50203.1 putative transposase [Fusobacterium phage vB_FnuS_FNU2]WGH50351.1 putative transposase [Fusobacterium phage vB_FnuS_FNU3]